MIQLFSVVAVNITYIIISNYLSLNQKIEYYIDSYKYSFQIIIFLLAIMTLFIRFQRTISLWAYITIALVITIFFHYIPLLRMNKDY